MRRFASTLYSSTKAIPNEQNNQLLTLFFYSSSYKCEKHTGGGLYSKVEMPIETKNKTKQNEDPSLWASS
jgi:hypothetical protein